jgi:5-methylcytosine-specific restriction endonuclease McrA
MKKPKDLNSYKSQGLKLFDIQPEYVRKPLELTNNNASNWRPIPKRVFFFNPSKIYEKINDLNLLNPYQRHCSVSMNHLFENDGNKCACGCGKELTGRQKRWASKSCNDFAFAVFSIISGNVNVLRNYRSIFIGGVKCEICNDVPKYEAVELDHIYPVKFGGGGGWLSNYQFKCKKCHREKTNKDFGYKSNSTKVLSALKELRDSFTEEERKTLFED